MTSSAVEPFDSPIKVERRDDGLVIVMPPERNRIFTIVLYIVGVILLAVTVFGISDMPDPVSSANAGWFDFLFGLIMPGRGYFYLVFGGAAAAFLSLAVILTGHRIRTYVTKGSIGVTHFLYSYPYFRIPLGLEQIESIKTGTHGNVYKNGEMIILYNIEAHVKDRRRKITLADNITSEDEAERLLELVQSAYSGVSRGTSRAP